MEFSFDQQPSSSTSHSLGSDRLRKAIERNRAKQAKRSARAQADTTWTAPGASSSPTTGSRRTVASADTVEFTSEIRKKRSQAPTQVSYVNSTSKRASTKAVTKYKPVKRKTKKSVAVKPNEYLVRGIWAFCAFLLLRLIFSHGGIIDYYEKKDLLKRKEMTLERTKKENSSLVKEIERIKTDASYQKKLVRNHLGHIAKDEYLILFTD